MLKSIITCLLIITFGQISAQRLFYLRPKLEVRTHHSYTSIPKFRWLFANNFQYAENPYFRAEGVKSFMLGGFQLGLNAGCVLDGGDLLEIGWNQGQSASMFRVIGLSSALFEEGGYSSRKKTLTAAGFFIDRFELLYYKRRKTDRYHNNLHVNDSYFIFGGGVKVSKLQRQIDAAFSLQGYDSVSLAIANETIGVGGAFPFLSVGISADINFNKKYWFSTSIIYTQGFRYMTNNRHRIIVQDGSEIKTYGYSTYSNGTGFQFQISRRFQVYPWKKRRKD